MGQEFTNKIELSPPPSSMESNIPQYFLRWFQQIFNRLGTGPFLVQGYNKADLVTGVDNPLSADKWGNTSTTQSFSSIIYVADESGGATLAFSNGSDWLRVKDLAIIS